MKYAFSEVGHDKSVSLVDMDAGGGVTVRELPLTPRRDLRRIRGPLRALLDDGPGDPAREDFLEVTLTDRGPVYDAMRRMREVYPNVLHVRRDQQELELRPGSTHRDLRRVDDRELFARFYETATGAELATRQAELYDELIAKLRSGRTDDP
jgi:exonuclease SbcD